jgi:threonine dehydratase
MAVADRTVTAADIEEAARLIKGRVRETPLVPAGELSRRVGTRVLLKAENLQLTGSFKPRGAFSAIGRLAPEALAAGVVAASAGNHAQAVAFAARQSGARATLVMPADAPVAKVAAVRQYGGEVRLVEGSYDEAGQLAASVAQDEGRTLIHAFDAAHVVAGQGTIGLELAEQLPHVESVVVPIGGGGLISGCAVAAKGLKPAIRVTGVEAALYPSMKAALEGRDGACGGQTLAEGIAVKNVGRLTLPIVRDLVESVRLVDEPDIERAIFTLLTRQRTVAEGAGAAGLAALLAEPGRWRGRKVGLVLCGGNIDPRMVAGIVVRGLEREDRVVSFRLTISDRPGLLGRVATLLGEAGANILEVSHRRLLLDVPAKGATLEVTIEARDAAHAADVMAALGKAGFEPRRVPTTAAGLDYA